MEKRGSRVDHYARFALRWRYVSKLRKERVTLILSPHLDDILLSLHRTILSGRMGRNIIGVNFFTSTDDEFDTNIKTDFATMMRCSTSKMKGELGFSDHLFSHGINYLPVFLGLRDAAIERYYRFIASSTINKLPSSELRGAASKLYSRFTEDYARELNIGTLLAPLFRQLKHNIDRVVAPMGIGTHIDHSVVAHASMDFSDAASFGVYAEIPYMYLSGSMSMDRLCARAPRGFTEPMVTRFDPKEKDALFKKLFPTQSNRMMSDAILEVGRALGEVVLWKGKRG